ncbi:hypothetical protein [Paraflavitalea pollutisoli]|uniref:hypothetical protein n=1 Tax=Paraflavitalea pollutisoli TaxID=3034143 RepID=UPI0023EAADD4|nr:hypothetical protein [Paraflavitalea sp. H1-2-19X]
MATPVHCWHHHLYETSSSQTADQPDTDGPALSLFKGSSLSNHCDICAHHFAVYEPAATSQYQFAPQQLRAAYAVYQAASLTATVHQFSNKGPPPGLIA